MELVPDILEEYVLSVSSPVPAILRELEAYTLENVAGAQMISGGLQGRLLSFVSQMHRPKTILEIGTYTGYSALCLAEGLHEDGMLHTIEIDRKLATIYDDFFPRSAYGHQIKVHFGDAKEIIPNLNLHPDLVFIDGAKKDYERIMDMVLEMMPSGGIILADNVLWKGKVTDPNNDEKNTLAMKAFNLKVKNDDRVTSFLLPIRDGLFFIKKK